jgi:hypothetical protein
MELYQNQFGIEIIEIYESFVLADLSSDQESDMVKHGYGNRIKSLNNRTVVSIGSFRFDTETELPKISPALHIESYEPGTYGLYIIQFIGPLKQSWLNQISTMDASLLNYIPNYAYLVRLNSDMEKSIRQLYFVQWLGIFQPAYKIDRQATDGKLGVTVLNSSTTDITLNTIQTSNEIISSSYDSDFDRHYLVVNIGETKVDKIASYPDVLFIEKYSDPRLLDETASEIVGGNWSANLPWNGPGSFINSLGWNGTNVTVSIADTGIGNGTVGNTGHLDFETRVINGTQYSTLTNWVDGHGHGTHVAGIVAGDGFQGTGVTYPTSSSAVKYYVGLGVAPDAYLIAQRIFDSAGNYRGPSSWDSFFQDAYNAGASIHQNSWGEGVGDSAYETNDVEYDQAVRDSATSTSGDQPMIIIVSAGNSGSSSGTIESPASAKNVITVGASENYHPDASSYGDSGGSSADNIDEIASFSSRGLEDDGRIKPDLVAPGTAVLSARSPSGSNTLHGIYSSDNRYLWSAGTSQAAPQVSGSAAAVVEWWRTNNSGANPSPAMVKAALINTAKDPGSPDIPNANEGWGRVYLPDLFNPSADMDFEDQEKLLQTGNKSIYNVYVASSTHPLKITIVWTDPAASALANPALVNNLDLKVTAPDNTTIYYGNVFSNGISTPGTANASSSWDTDSDGFDERNNVESIFIPSNDVQVGIYKVEVIGENIGTDAVSNTSANDQDYALVISGDLSEPDDVGVDSVEAPVSQQKDQLASIKASIKNYGTNNVTSPFNARIIIKDPNNLEVLNSTKTINSLAVFDISNQTWSYTPTIVGRYTITVRTELGNDDNNANNATSVTMTVPYILDEIATFTGLKTNDRFGWNVSFAGDLNGDGYDDVIIGAPYNDSLDGSKNESGAAYIFFGPRTGNYSAENADVKIYGSIDYALFGWDVAGIGDINGTYNDVIIGAPGYLGFQPGYAYIFTGWTITNDADGILFATDADSTINGETNDDRFGSSVAAAGNVDNSGLDDIIIGAFNNDNNGMTNNGRAYLFYGDGSIPTAAASADKIFNGTMDNELFGFSVSSAGDIDNDNTKDMIVGAPGADNDTGRAYIIGGFVTISAGDTLYDFANKSGENKWFYHKNTDSVNPPPSGPDITGESELTSYSTIEASDNTRTPQHPDSENGASANLYNQHHFKFIIDEPVNAINSFTILWEGYNTKATSNMYIWNLNTDTSDSAGSGTSTSSDNTVTNTYSASIGNYINITTGRLDFVVTAKDGAKALWRYLYTDYVKVNVSSKPYIDSSFRSTIEGETEDDLFGWSVNSSGNVNGDGYDDAVIGAPGFDSSLGRAYVIYGSSSLEENITAEDANITLIGGKTGDKFGYSVGSTDLTADGYSDIIIGAPFNDTLDGSKSNAGSVFVYEGSSSPPEIMEAADYTKSGEKPEDRLGWSVSNAFKMNTDGYNDIIVGAPHYDNNTITDVGKAYVLSVIPEYPIPLLPLIITAFIIMVIRKTKSKNKSLY